MSKLKLVQEQEIIAAFASGHSQFKISTITGYDQSAVRRVLRDYKRARELWPKLKGRPSDLAEILQSLAEATDNEELELFWPVPKVSAEVYLRLVESRGLKEEGKENLAEIRKFTELFEALEGLEAVFKECCPSPNRPNDVETAHDGVIRGGDTTGE